MSLLRLMSQNQWNYVDNNETWEAMGLDCSARVRMPQHVEILQTLLPDILGGQEVNAVMQQLLVAGCVEKGLPYTLIWGSMTPILYRSDKLELLDQEFLPYPEEMEGFAGIFNDFYSKACNIGVFRVKEDGKVFIFATTHLWWMNGSDPANKWYREGSDEVRMLQLKMANAKIEAYRVRYGNCPVILVGDLNTDYRSQAIQYALTEGGYQHGHDVAVEFAHEENGYNYCMPFGPGKWEHKPFEDAIDHILVKGLPADAVRRFDRYETEAYCFVSDHAPVWIDVEI